MVVRAGDRLSTVIAQDAAVVDVFAALSPVFERLRSRTMRTVMSRLVTIEHAARIAGVDPGELVDRLNAFLNGTERGPMDGNAIEATRQDNGARPAILDAIPREAIVEVDVRDELRAGREPFSLIMAARRSVPPGGALVVRAIFEPVPLYTVMRRQGLDHWTERLGDDDWRVWFHAVSTVSDDRSVSADAGPTEPSGPGDAVADDDVVILDVRGLEPPEPMERTLAALEQLPAGSTLVQINVRTPQFLLPLLTERGFAYEVTEQHPGLVRVFIRHRH